MSKSIQSPEPIVSKVHLEQEVFSSRSKGIVAAAILGVVGFSGWQIHRANEQSSVRTVSDQHLTNLRSCTDDPVFTDQVHRFLNMPWDDNSPHNLSRTEAAQAREIIAKITEHLSRIRAEFDIFVLYEVAHPYYGRAVPTYGSQIQSAVRAGALRGQSIDWSAKDLSERSNSELTFSEAAFELGWSCDRVAASPGRIRGCGTLMHRSGADPDRVGASTSLVYFQSFSEDLSRAEYSCARLAELLAAQ